MAGRSTSRRPRADDPERDRAPADTDRPDADRLDADRSDAVDFLARDHVFANTTLDLDAVSEADLDALVFEDDHADDSIWNAPTLAGLALVVVGALYLAVEAGAVPMLAIGPAMGLLAWLGGLLILLLGVGLLGSRIADAWRRRRQRAKEARTTDPDASAAFKPAKAARLRRSRTDKKLAGVCGGLADYFNIDPTLVRIAFVIGLVVSGGNFVWAYLVMAFVMPKSDRKTKRHQYISEEERARIIRES
jgi:phage shock protein C